MDRSRRILLAGMTALAVAPAAAPALAATALAATDLAATGTAEGVTVAEEHYARVIALAHAPDVTCAHQAERYADAHWQEYVSAARAVLDARV